MKPMAVTPTESGDKYFCQCKATSTPPYCDGTHARLPKEATTVDIEDLASKKAAGGDGSAKSNQAKLLHADSTAEEDTLAYVKALARGEYDVGHGEMGAMGVPRTTLPSWNDIQLVTGQMWKQPLLDGTPVGTELIIGPRAKKPLRLDIPIFVSDASFGALSRPAKVALARGAQLAGTGICSGEGGMLPAEQAENSRYFYEIASALFGYSDEVVAKAQAVHFKGGQGAKSGTGGHLSGNKVTKEIAEIRGLKPGQDAISPSTFKEWHSAADFKKVADRCRELTGGAPVGFKLSAQHIERDIDFALEASADYIILDGRGGGTGAAPLLFRDNISVPTIPALARARRHLDKRDAKDVTLIITGGLRTPADFVKALAMGADGIAVVNSAIQSIGCVGARICNTGLCPAGVATQDPERVAAFGDIDVAAKQLHHFFLGSIHQMSLLARACGHDHLSKFTVEDLTTWKHEMHLLSGVPFAGFTPSGV